MQTVLVRSIAGALLMAATAVGCGNGGGGGSTGQKPALEITGSIVSPGVAISTATAADGATAYLSTQGALLVLDVLAQRFERLFPQSSFTTRFVDAVDATDTHVAVHSFSSAGLIDVSNGAYTELIIGGSLQRTVIANGYLYAPDSGAGVLQVAGLDGSPQFSINPYPADGSRFANATNAARSPSGRTVMFGDDSNASIHVVDTETNTLRGTFISGISPRQLIAVSDDLAITVVEGLIAYVPLVDPTHVPELYRVDLLNGVVAVALHHGSGQLFVLRFEGSDYTTPPTPFKAEVGVLNIATREEVGGRVPIDIDFFPGFTLAVTDDGATVILTAGDTVYFLEPTTPSS